MIVIMEDNYDELMECVMCAEKKIKMIKELISKDSISHRKRWDDYDRRYRSRFDD